MVIKSKNCKLAAGEATNIINNFDQFIKTLLGDSLGELALKSMNLAASRLAVAYTEINTYKVQVNKNKTTNRNSVFYN